MKRVILLAVIQAVVLFFIIGALAYAFKGDFFYNYLAVVFAPIAGVLRFASAYGLHRRENKSRNRISEVSLCHFRKCIAILKSYIVKLFR